MRNVNRQGKYDYKWHNAISLLSYALTPAFTAVLDTVSRGVWLTLDIAVSDDVAHMRVCCLLPVMNPQQAIPVQQEWVWQS